MKLSENYIISHPGSSRVLPGSNGALMLNIFNRNLLLPATTDYLINKMSITFKQITIQLTNQQIISIFHFPFALYWVPKIEIHRKKNSHPPVFKWSLKRKRRKSVPTKGLHTTNLSHHLQQCLKVQYEECVKLRAVYQSAKSSQPLAWKQTILQNSYTRAVPYERKSKK